MKQNTGSNDKTGRVAAAPSVAGGSPPGDGIQPLIKIGGREVEASALHREITMNLLRRPLWHPYMVESCLDMLRYRLAMLLDNGQLPWVWDLGTGRQRKEIRILGHSVIERVMGPIPAIGATKKLDLPEVVNLVLPPQQYLISSMDLQRIFHGGPDLVRELCLSGEIKKVAGKRRSEGGKEIWYYSRCSVTNLLAKRRVT